MNDIVKVLIFSSSSYIILFILSKFLGKKQIAELDFIDYVTGISIGSIAAEMATETVTPFYYYVIAMVAFFLFDSLVSALSRKTNFFKKFLRGVPLILINNGKVDYKQLKKSKIDFYDLLSMARDKGYFSIDEILYAIFETNGDLSILAKDNNRALKKEDFPSIPRKKPSLPLYVVVDRQISKFALNSINKTKKWLQDELKKQNTNKKDILYAIYNIETKKLEITKK